MSRVDAFLSLIAVAAFYLGCIGWGGVCIRLIPGGVKLEEGAFRLSLVFLLGLLLIGAMLTGLACGGWFFPPYIISILAVGMLLFLFVHADKGSFVGSSNSGVATWQEMDTYAKIIAVVLCILVAGFAASAWIRPPIGDAEAFYMTYAKLIAATGRLLPMPGYEAFSSIGLSGELQFAALISIGGTAAAKLITWFVAIATTLSLVRITSLCGGGSLARLLATAVLFTSTTFTYYIVDGKVDLFAAAFGLATIALAIDRWEEPNPASWALVGLFAGAATAAKFSYLVCLGASLGCIILWRCHDGRFPSTMSAWIQTLRIAALVALLGVAAWIPQLLKNGVLFGAPLAPFLGGPSGGDYLQQTWFSPEVTLRIVLSYPLALVFGRYPMQGGGLSLLMIAFVPLVVFLPKIRSCRFECLRVVTLAGLLGILAWLALRPSIIAPRYILASLLLLVPVVACASEFLWSYTQTPRILRLGMFLTTMAALAATAWLLVPVPRALAMLFLGRLPPHLLASPYCQPLSTLNEVASAGDRVFVATWYTYWLRPDLLMSRDSEVERGAVQKLGKHANADELIAKLRHLGFRYIVADKASHRELTDRIVPVLEAQGSSCIAKSEAVSVWEINGVVGPAASAPIYPVPSIPTNGQTRRSQSLDSP